MAASALRHILQTWILFLTFQLVVPAFAQEFMTDICGEQMTDRVSGRLETSQSLTYSNLLDCEISISVATDKRIILYFRRFDMEEPMDGACVDYLNIHDGLTTDSPTLHPDPLCGPNMVDTNLTTSADSVTFHLVTDDSAVFRGFAIEYAAFSEPPCSSGDFLCDSGICIDSSNVCDDINQCGDSSDEQSCTVEEEASDGINVALVAGCTVAAVLGVVIIVVVIYKVVKYLQWKKLTKTTRTWVMEDLYQYPVTDLYNKYDIGFQGRREYCLSFENSAIEIGEVSDVVSLQNRTDSVVF